MGPNMGTDDPAVDCSPLAPFPDKSMCIVKSPILIGSE